MKRVLALLLVTTMVIAAGAVPALARKAPAEEPPAAEVTAVVAWDVNGTWNLTIEPSPSTLPSSISLTMDPITGALSGGGTNGTAIYTLTGAVDGSSISIGYSDDALYTADLTGTITATSIAGTWEDNTEGPGGTFTASGAATQLMPIPIEGFAWMAPIRLNGKPVHVGGNLTIKFRLGMPAADDEDEIEEPEEEAEPPVEPILPVEPIVPVAEPELKIVFGTESSAISLKRCGDSMIYLAHFRPAMAGEYTAQAYLDGVLIGSINFTVAEHGAKGMGNGKGAAGDGSELTIPDPVKGNNRNKNKDQ